MKSRAPYRSRLRDSQAAATRGRILEAVAAVLERGEEPTFALVASQAGCQERTVYRYFPTREQLASAFWEWQYEVVAPSERSASSLDELLDMVGRAFTAFDGRAELVRAMLHTRHGREARLSDNPQRRAMVLRCVDSALPGLDRRTRRQVAAATQALFSAATWEVLRDYWDMDGAEAAGTVQLAMTAMFEGLGRRARSRRPSARST
ncbi:MAG TPA: TetR/AcrR family transcriptional regulator [Kofleriaceae bacterium]|nr:TetR/AcrR family transcriptional regulator [Kofleriaceae bacterium]